MTDLEKGIIYLEKYNHVEVPFKNYDFSTFRALMNITMPEEISDDFYRLQDAILQAEYKKKKITDVLSLSSIYAPIYLYLGDITLLKADAIVNAANSALLGCFHPLHHCIDNAIHSFAGLQVRRDLLKIMKAQGHEEPSGDAKITKGYNLPSSYILHTVGPMVKKKVTKQDETDLYRCYQSCLALADRYDLKSIVFCSISTGLYGFPIEAASRIALKSIKDYLKKNPNTSIQKVIIDVFKKEDYDVYQRAIEECYR